MTSEALPDTAQIEAVRQGTPVAMAVTTETDQGTQSYTFYVYQSCVLVEPTETDITSVATVATDDLGSFVADLIDPLHAAGEHREVEQFATLDDFANSVDRYPVLSQTVALSTLTLVDRAADASQTFVFYASPNGVAVLEGGPTKDNPDMPYALTEVSADDLAEAVGRLLSNVTLPDPMPAILE